MMRTMQPMWLVVNLLGAVTAFGAEVHVTPEGAGAADGSSWEHAFPGRAVNQVFNEVMQPGDRMLLGSGTYRDLQVRVRNGGSEGQAKRLKGIDTGAGLPLLQGSWSVDHPSKGPTAIRLEAGVSHLEISDLRIEGYNTGILQRASKPLRVSSHLVFAQLHLSKLRYGVYLSDCSDLTIRDCQLARYTKHGFRFEAGCSRVRVIGCTADCSQGDHDWETKTELFPFGFTVNRSDRAQADFLFQDCVARNNRMPQQKEKYKNGDGFVVERTTKNVRFIRCRAIRNQDGGFDIKAAGTTFQDCVALDNSRGFRLWDTATLVNCLAGRGGTGLWINGGTVTVERSTFFACTYAAVLTDDRAGRDNQLDRCIIASCNATHRKTSTGSVSLKDTILSKTPGGDASVTFVQPDPAWDGDSNGMDSLSHPDRGYRHP